MASVWVGRRSRNAAVFVSRCTLFIAVLLRPLEAHAFVRGTTSWTDGKPLSWSSGCVVLAVGDPQSDLVSWDQLTDAARAAAATWTEAAAACGGFQLVVEKAGGPLDAARGDGVNAVIFRSTGYCQQGCDPLSLAITWLYYDGDGRMHEADIEINGEAYQWDADIDGGTALYDLQTGIAHELGHLLGLAHNCYEGMGLPRPVDDQGVPAVICDPAATEVHASIMYPSDEPSADRRALSADDVRGICAIYPSGLDPTCQGGLTPDGGCCAIAPRVDSKRTFVECLAGVLFVLAALRRRRRS